MTNIFKTALIQATGAYFGFIAAKWIVGNIGNIADLSRDVKEARRIRKLKNENRYYYYHK